LGLAIVMAFTQLHGGEICTEDAHPGLRVKMTFPRPAARVPM
jgi:signal transduction histidine kinase